MDALQTLERVRPTLSSFLCFFNGSSGDLRVEFMIALASVRHMQTADLQTADLQTCRPVDLQTCRPADLQTRRPADLQTRRLNILTFPNSFLN